MRWIKLLRNQNLGEGKQNLYSQIWDWQSSLILRPFLQVWTGQCLCPNHQWIHHAPNVRHALASRLCSWISDRNESWRGCWDLVAQGVAWRCGITYCQTFSARSWNCPVGGSTDWPYASGYSCWSDCNRLACQLTCRVLFPLFFHLVISTKQATIKQPLHSSEYHQFSSISSFRTRFHPLFPQ